jgi:hypothetical protein
MYKEVSWGPVYKQFLLRLLHFLQESAGLFLGNEVIIKTCYSSFYELRYLVVLAIY